MFRLLFKILLISTALNLAFCNATRAQSAAGSTGTSLTDTNHEESLLKDSLSPTSVQEITINIAANDEDDIQFTKATHEVNTVIILPQSYSIANTPTRSAITNNLPIYIILHKYRV